MVRSCLIEPLVKPLIASRGNLGRRSALSGSRLAATALALSALAAVTTYAHATQAALESEALRSKVESTVVANAHRLPEKAAPKVVLARFLASIAAEEARREDDLVSAPDAAPDFDQDALDPTRLRQSSAADPGPRLRIAVHSSRRTRGAHPTYLLFGSAQHRAGIPTS